MQLNAKMFLIVCPMLFIAGLVDAIGGGGGLISLPAYLFAGLPIHYSIATNKLSSTCAPASGLLKTREHQLSETADGSESTHGNIIAASQRPNIWSIM